MKHISKSFIKNISPHFHKNKIIYNNNNSLHHKKTKERKRKIEPKQKAEVDKRKPTKNVNFLMGFLRNLWKVNVSRINSPSLTKMNLTF